MDIKTFMMQNLRFLDNVMCHMKTHRFNLTSFRLQRCCHQAFAAHISSCSFNDCIFGVTEYFVSMFGGRYVHN